MKQLEAIIRQTDLLIRSIYRNSVTEDAVRCAKAMGSRTGSRSRYEMRYGEVGEIN